MWEVIVEDFNEEVSYKLVLKDCKDLDKWKMRWRKCYSLGSGNVYG